MTTTAITRLRWPRGQHPKKVDQDQELQPKPLPQYLEAHEVQAIIRASDDPRARLLGQVPGRGVRVRHPDCTAQAAVDCVSGASCSASCFVVTPGVR